MQAYAHPAAHSAANDGTQHPASSVLRVLIVDDSTPIRMLIASKLRNIANGTFELLVDEVETGEDALNHASRETYDLIIMDVEMPGIGGLESCQRLKQFGCPARIVMLSGRTSAEAHRAGREAGCDNYLTKPPNEADLRSIMRLVSLRKEASL